MICHLVFILNLFNPTFCKSNMLRRRGLRRRWPLFVGRFHRRAVPSPELALNSPKKSIGENFPMLFCVVVLFFTFLLCKNKRAIRLSEFLPTSYTSKHFSSDNVPVFQNPRRIIRSVSHSHLTMRKHPSMTI